MHKRTISNDKKHSPNEHQPSVTQTTNKPTLTQLTAAFDATYVEVEDMTGTALPPSLPLPSLPTLLHNIIIFLQSYQQEDAAPSHPIA